MSLKNSFYESVVWRASLFVSSAVLNILIARFLKAEATGWFYYFISILALIILITGLSLESGIGYFAAKKEIPVSQLGRLTIIWTIVVGVGTLIAGASLFARERIGTMQSEWLVLCSTCYITGSLLFGYLSSFFYAKLNFKIPNIIGIATNIALIGLLVYYTSSTGRQREFDFVILFCVSFLLQGIMLFVCFKLYFKDDSKGLPARNEVIQLLRYTGLAYFANIVFFILYRLDYYFVNRYCSESDFGNYVQVSRLAQLFFVLPGIIAGVVFSLSARDEKDMIDRILLPLCRILFYLFSGICLFLAITGHYLFPTVFGHTFDRMYQPFMLLIPGIVFLCALYPLTAFYAGKNKIHVNISGSVIALIIIIAGDILLIPRFGIEGAAFVSSLGYLSYYLYVLITFCRDFHLKFSQFFLLRKTDIQLCMNLIKRNASGGNGTD